MSEKCTCGHSPVIVIPGIGQTRTYLVNEKGERIKRAWPIEVDQKKFLSELQGSMAKMMLLRRDMGFSDKLAGLIAEAVDPISYTNEGKAKHRVSVETFDNSFAECSEDERKFIFRMVPLEDTAALVSEDHLYYFAYNSFGAPYEAAADLRAFIKKVREETGHDKVSIVPVSLGACVATAYFDAYGDDGDIDRVLYFVGAVDGTAVFADFFERNLDAENSSDIFGMFLGKEASEKFGSVLKFLPKGVADNVIDKVLTAVIDTLMRNCPMMWALIPVGRYEKIRDMHLKDKKYDALRALTDRFHDAHLNFKDTVRQKTEEGVKFFAICGYGKKLPKFSPSKNMTSDEVINLSSASLFAESADLGESFPEGYKQKNTYCREEGHNHISPGSDVDASTGLIPDSTWYFCGQNHDATAYNDVALKIAARILGDNDFRDVYSDSRYPQFNGSRNIRKVKYNLLPKLKKADAAGFSPENLKIYAKAIDETEKFFDNTTIKDNEETKRIEALLENALTALGIVDNGK
ncbi:MAG: hypothetical protein FWF08_02325 [Oscillospiraceae bacterium]|nr:hypothetical protein [Oscillospiraceae bacterium]